jgi:hemerythrin-like domain-containing protein
MQATEILMQEHRVIEQVLDSLQAATLAVENGSSVRPAFFIDAADFIRGFADGCHHHKEEGVLFRMMESHGLPTQGGPVGMMLHEHELGRKYTRGMRVAAEKWEQGDESARAEVVANASAYVALLRQHIQKEDHILFPMADRVIPLSAHPEVVAGFEHVEHEETGEGIHEKYLALASALGKEVRALSVQTS